MSAENMETGCIFAQINLKRSTQVVNCALTLPDIISPVLNFLCHLTPFISCKRAVLLLQPFDVFHHFVHIKSIHTVI